MYGSRSGGLVVLMLVIGIGLIYNCIKGLASGEGMYDRESSSIMFWAQIMGIIAGLGLIGWAYAIGRIMFMI